MIQPEQKGVRYELVKTFGDTTNSKPWEIGLQELCDPKNISYSRDADGTVRLEGSSLRHALLRFEVHFWRGSGDFFFSYLRGDLEPNGEFVSWAGLCMQADVSGIHKF